MAKENQKDTDKATSSFILQFYQDVQQINGSLATYQNTLLELENKYNGKFNEMEDQDKNVLTQVLQTLRYNLIVAYQSYKAIDKVLADKLDTKEQQAQKKALQKAYDSIKTTYIIKVEDLEIFTDNLNDFLTSEIMRNLLVTSNELASRFAS